MTNEIQDIASVFISYAREDSKFVIELKTALEENKVRCYGDWNITAATKFETKLKEDNLAATIFLFIISPDSINSNECKKEIALAVENKKVILPVSYRDHIDDNLLDSAIRAPQWVFLKTKEDFEKGIPAILEALKTDFALLDIHSRLLLEVDEWVSKNKNSSYLLKKAQLKEAEEWLQKTALQPDKLPQPTPVQIEYIVASQRSRTKSTRILLGISLIIMLILISISVYALIAKGRANENEKKANENAEEAHRQTVVAVNNLKRFKIEEFNRNVRNGKVYLDAEEYCFAKQVLDSARKTIEDTLCSNASEIIKQKSIVLELLDSSNKKCKLK